MSNRNEKHGKQGNKKKNVYGAWRSLPTESARSSESGTKKSWGDKGEKAAPGKPSTIQSAVIIERGGGAHERGCKKGG